jgi:hypothetical protein
VALAFADHTDDEGVCFPSIERIAYKTGYKRRQTQSIVGRLKRKGILQPIDREWGGRGHATVYRVCPGKGVKSAPFEKRWISAYINGRPDAQKGEVTTAPQSSITTKESTPPIVPLEGDKPRFPNDAVVHVMRVWGGVVCIKAPPRRRLWTMAERESLAGCRAEDYLRFFRSKGFEAWVEEDQSLRCD